jgi:hypothetical protein
MTMAACERPGRELPATPAPDSPTAIAWSFDAPPSWGDRVQLEDNATMPGAWRSARLFVYTPRDTTVRPQTLLAIIVYDSAAWAELRREEGPPQGDSLSSHAGQVFVASLPQSNPFAQGSADARTFDSLVVDATEVRRRFRVMQ